MLPTVFLFLEPAQLITPPPLDLNAILDDVNDRLNTSDDMTDADAAIDIAQRLLERSRQLQTPQERRQQAELDRMIGHPGDKATLVEMTDQAFRTHSPARVADQLTHLLDLQGIPRFFSPLEQTMLKGFQTFGEYLPGVAVPLVKEKMRQETANVILPAEETPLREHLSARQETGVLMNLNFLGEALLGEEEAERRLQHYLHALQTPEIACISVKLSTIYSQVSTLARDHTVAKVADRLELLYRAAARETFQHSDGSTTSKFVYLDMEEYRDLELTAAVFTETLDRPGMSEVRAGIALQAYIPDSDIVLERLLSWADTRAAAGKPPITIRLVKGANMEMERVEASLGGWPQTPYDQKLHTDANFKRMLNRLIASAAQGHVRIGVASHNLFDIALALLWGHRAKLSPTSSSTDTAGSGTAGTDTAGSGTALDHMQFEMLEGMANHQRRALFEVAPQMLLYAPACKREDFLNAIGYLIRRLDENTGEENFLRHTFRLTPGSDVWNELADGFRQSLDQMESVSRAPRRIQNRHARPEQPSACESWGTFVTEPDTDWSLPQNGEWALKIVARWSTRCDDAAESVPLRVGEELRTPDSVTRYERESVDPSRPKVIACRFTQANDQDVKDAIAIADADPSNWRGTTAEHRHRLFRSVAQLMRERRGDLIGATMIDGGKLISEADPELNEAIDFVEFYPLSAKAYFDRAAQPNSGIELSPLGTVAVISPWNFPLAIPCGGIVAALAAGNTVILKPASDTVLPAYKMAECFWDAGVPRTALQVIPCSGGGAGQLLVSDERVKAVVLTGGTETAQQMLAMRPGLNLIAETGGKNATVVTALSDRDLAIKNVLHSAFGHSGQKCSATSLLLLQQELYDDKHFREALADAAESLTVGSVWELESKVGPMVAPPSGVLEKGLKELEPGEDWLVMPKRIGNSDRLFSPGIKWNVRPGSFTHQTELFGPVLGVMSFGRLEEAIEMVNATGYGLTSGLESLDVREQRLWLENIRAGNLYINRPTTGAIVLRQPFGGLGSSGYGPGSKAGGPHYVLALMKILSPDFPTIANAPDIDLPDSSPINDELSALKSFSNSNDAIAGDSFPLDEFESFASAAQSLQVNLFDKQHDHFNLVGQDNVRKYLPVRQLRVRLSGDESAASIALSMLAAAAARCDATYSLPPGNPKLLNFLGYLTEKIALDGNSDWRPEWLEESDEAVAAAIADGRVDRLRVFHDAKDAPPEILIAAREAFVTVLGLPIVADAEIETLRYLNEQSLSHTYHRYGNLGRRAVQES